MSTFILTIMQFLYLTILTAPSIYARVIMVIHDDSMPSEPTSESPTAIVARAAVSIRKTPYFVVAAILGGIIGVIVLILSITFIRSWRIGTLLPVSRRKRAINLRREESFCTKPPPSPKPEVRPRNEVHSSSEDDILRYYLSEDRQSTLVDPESPSKMSFLSAEYVPNKKYSRPTPLDLSPRSKHFRSSMYSSVSQLPTSPKRVQSTLVDPESPSRISFMSTDYVPDKKYSRPTPLDLSPRSKRFRSSAYSSASSQVPTSPKRVQSTLVDPESPSNMSFISAEYVPNKNFSRPTPLDTSPQTMHFRSSTYSSMTSVMLQMPPPSSPKRETFAHPVVRSQFPRVYHLHDPGFLPPLPPKDPN